MISWLEQIDRDLFLVLNGCHSPFFDDVFWVITSKFFGIPFYMLAVFLLTKKYGWKTGLLLTTGGLVAFGLADQISNHVFKDVFLRWRPGYNLEIKHLVHNVMVDGALYRGKIDASFLSAHAANMFAIATFVGLMSTKKILLVGFFIAALIGYSRIYLGVHYLSDVIGGCLLGISIGYLLYKLIFIPIQSKL